MNIDLLLSGGSVVDGTGAPGYRADVAITNGKIKEIGRLTAPPEVPVLDAAGLVVAPGFIDIHSHSDFTLTVDPRAQSAINQGVTLEVVGNCGHGCAPFTDAALVRTNLYGYVPGFDFPWKSVGEYLSYLESRKPAVNVAALVPNGNLRLAVLGLVSRSSTSGEVQQMKKLLEQGLDEGALGFSSGLEYAIEQDCSEEEIVELCRATKRVGKYYATHTRNRVGQPEESIAEAIRTAQAADVPLQISHITVISRLTDKSRWAVERGLEQVEEARDRGLDVGFDVHTRTFGTTNLSAVLPSWALAGETSAIAERLKSPSIRKEMEQYPSIVSALARGHWEKIVVFDSKVQPEISRRSIADISEERGTSIFDTIYDLLLAEIEDVNALMIGAFNYRAEDLQLAFTHPDCMVGSDAVALATDGPLKDQTLHGSYTWASWFFRYFVRERKLLPLEEAVRRLTSLPAKRLRLRDRGIVRVGNWADLAIFDPSSFAERGTTFDPNQLAIGMKHVLVNGVLTLHNGAATGKHGGHVLRAQ
jgi:N-acyl-D-amino-acid deacylase